MGSKHCALASLGLQTFPGQSIRLTQMRQARRICSCPQKFI